eukprot:3481940-Pleurochrysis_carterae.AAC.2
MASVGPDAYRRKGINACAYLQAGARMRCRVPLRTSERTTDVCRFARGGLQISGRNHRGYARIASLYTARMLVHVQVRPHAFAKMRHELLCLETVRFVLWVGSRCLWLLA